MTGLEQCAYRMRPEVSGSARHRYMHCSLSTRGPPIVLLYFGANGIESSIRPVAPGAPDPENRFVKAATFEGVMPRGRVSDALIDFHSGARRGCHDDCRLLPNFARWAGSPRHGRARSRSGVTAAPRDRRPFQLVAMARALLRDPNFVKRFRADTAAEGRCIHCMKCMPTVYSGTHCVVRRQIEAAPAG